MEFDDFANINLEKLLGETQEQFAKLEELQQRTNDAVGRAQDKNGLVTVEYGQDGLRELELNPRAMRLASADLAELIKTTIGEAAQDLNAQTNELFEEVFGAEGNPMRLMKDPEGAMAKVKEAEAAYNRTVENVMGEFEQIRRRLQG
ncbi:YbaB/EbfC family nucleoid-associated protein [Sphaerisporangium fuscum]|uniref:YbaB/EbfC family nucleoid-associated protein n=1 Tax=Sphaerisporangium fuscum TaxID=2835868 RepID=UPI001BDC5C18|nr:YbaB/EbfC family nucleoid-associated protein [Sphaerisporangium fuscum]